jgi:hypothetical protein
MVRIRSSSNGVRYRTSKRGGSKSMVLRPYSWPERIFSDSLAQRKYSVRLVKTTLLSSLTSLANSQKLSTTVW